MEKFVIDKKSKTNKKNIALITLFILVLLLIIVFGAKTFLYFQVLLGNDLVLKLNADPVNLFLMNGESGKITITSQALANFFCETNCTSKFIDLSSGEIIDSDGFNLKLPKTKEFTLAATDLGTGQKLYRFDLECFSPKTFLCSTTGITKKSTLLLTMNYQPTEQEIALKNEISNNLSYYLGDLAYIQGNLDEFNIVLDKMNNTIEYNELKNKTRFLHDSISMANSSSSGLLNLWENSDYNELYNEFFAIETSFATSKDDFNELNDSINSNITLYDSLIDNLTKIKSDINDMQKLNLTDNSSEILNNLSEEYNNIVIEFPEKDYISNKKENIDNLLTKTENFIPHLSNSSNITHEITPINNIIYEKISLNLINFSYYVLEEPYPTCCFEDNCQKCCDNTCANKEADYPIIFIHGHSFNQGVSAEESLDSFEEIQRALENDSYINAGSLYLSSSNDNTTGVWGKINYPLSIKATYYFDLLTNQGQDVIIQTKTDNLDTYTLRLREIISDVKLKTNKQKVILIAHSMGGLIARRYIQVFGESDIDKLILIDVPNQGISGKTSTICPVFGTKLECNDMNKDSLFMNKLNNAIKPKIPIYNIIGIGCDTNGENGDGVVINSSQYLSYANNYYVNGTCIDSQFTYLHTEIINPDEYPKTLELIKGFLNNSNISPTKTF